MCPPAASSTSFGELGPIVPTGARWVIGTCELPVTAVGGAHLIMVDCASSLNGGRGVGLQEGTGQRRWHGRFRGESAFCSFSSLAGQGVLVMAVATVMFRHVWVVNGAAVPVVGVPVGQDAVGVVAVDMWGRTPATPMAHAEAVETKPLHRGIRTHQVTWTTPSDDNCRQAVDGT
jgi:hypothetical protein